MSGERREPSPSSRAVAAGWPLARGRHGVRYADVRFPPCDRPEDRPRGRPEVRTHPESCPPGRPGAGRTVRTGAGSRRAGPVRGCPLSRAGRRRGCDRLAAIVLDGGRLCGVLVPGKGGGPFVNPPDERFGSVARCGYPRTQGRSAAPEPVAMRDLSRLTASASVIPTAVSTFPWDDPALDHRTAARGRSSQSATRIATARFARPPDGGARQLTTHRLRQGSQSRASVRPPGFTQRGIRATGRISSVKILPGGCQFREPPRAGR
jgi:hypothetical protein